MLKRLSFLHWQVFEPPWSFPCMRGFISKLYSVPLMYLSIFKPIPHYLHCCHFIMSWNQMFIFITKVVLAILGPLHFIRILESMCQVLQKNLLFNPQSNFGRIHRWTGAFLMANMVKNLPAVQETWVHSLGLGRSVEKGMDNHSSILAAESHGQRSLATVHSVTKNQTWLSD